MASFTIFFDSDLGWQGWHGLCFGLHVGGRSCLVDDGPGCRVLPNFFDVSLGWQGWYSLCFGWHRFFFDSGLGWQDLHSLCFGLHFGGQSFWVDDDVLTNPGLDGKFYRVFLILARVGKVGKV